MTLYCTILLQLFSLNVFGCFILVSKEWRALFFLKGTKLFLKAWERSIQLVHHKTERTFRNGFRIIGCEVRKRSELHHGESKRSGLEKKRMSVFRVKKDHGYIFETTFNV